MASPCWGAFFCSTGVVAKVRFHAVAIEKALLSGPQLVSKRFVLIFHSNGGTLSRAGRVAPLYRVGGMFKIFVRWRSGTGHVMPVEMDTPEESVAANPSELVDQPEPTDEEEQRTQEELQA